MAFIFIIYFYVVTITIFKMLLSICFLWDDSSSEGPIVPTRGAPQSVQKTESLEYSVVGTDTWQDNSKKMHLNCLVSNALSSTLYLDWTTALRKRFFFNVKHQILQTIPYFPGSHSNFHQKSNRRVYFKAIPFASNKCDQKMISNNGIIYVLGLVMITQKWAKDEKKRNQPPSLRTYIACSVN